MADGQPNVLGGWGLTLPSSLCSHFAKEWAERYEHS